MPNHFDTSTYCEECGPVNNANYSFDVKRTVDALLSSNNNCQVIEVGPCPACGLKAVQRYYNKIVLYYADGKVTYNERKPPVILVMSNFQQSLPDFDVIYNTFINLRNSSI